MKKLIAMLLVLVMAVSMAACGENPDSTPSTNGPTDGPTNGPTDGPTNGPTDGPTNGPTDGPTNPPVVLPASALELMQGLWTSYTATLSEDQMFPVAGGFSDVFEEMVDGNAGPVKLEVEGALHNLFVPDEFTAQVEEASSVMHMMNANTFTAGGLKLKEGTDVAAFTQAMRDMIANNHWWCGFPDRFVIASVGSYVVIVYGQDGIETEGFKTAEIVTPFINALSQLHPTTQILFNELISG